MKTISKVSIVLVSCTALLVGLAVFGVSLKLETKPAAVSAYTCNDSGSGACGSVSLGIKINGKSHGYGSISILINHGDPVTLSWTSSGTATCNTGVQGHLFGTYASKPTSGSYTFTPTVAGAFALQCDSVGQPGNMIIQDAVGWEFNQNTTPACNTNADCGTNGFTGALTCQNNDVYQGYKTYTCNNPGTASASCSNNTVSQLKQMCAASQACNTGGCFPETW